MTTVVNVKYHEYDVYIGRSNSKQKSIWGNPFSHLENSTAAFKVKTKKEAVDKYKQWILTQPMLLEQLETLRNKRLGCWCVDKNGKGICHGRVLIELLEARKTNSIF